MLGKNKVVVVAAATIWVLRQSFLRERVFPAPKYNLVPERSGYEISLRNECRNFTHSRPESLLEAWARGPGGSGDTGFEVLDFRTVWSFLIFYNVSTAVIAFTCSCRSDNNCKFRWFKAFKRESSKLLLNQKWLEVLKSRTSNPVLILCPQSVLVLVLRSPGGSGDDPDMGSVSGWLRLWFIQSEALPGSG